jgi:N-acetylneuraminic acid mutarotase
MRKTLLLLLFLIPLFLPAQNSWEKKTSFAASKRARAVAFTIAGRGYLATGEDTLDNEMNDLWEYDPGSDSWTQKANIPAAGRRDAVGFSIGTKGYVGTGIDASEAFLGNTLADFWEYSPVTNTWTSKAAFPGGWGSGIYFATGFAVNGKGYVCCGKIGPSLYSQELWEFNPAANTWTQKAPFPGGVRYGQSSFVIGSKAYIGLGTDENWFVSDFWEYNPASNTWTQKAAFPGSSRSFATAFTLNQHGYFGLGTDGGYRDDWFEYDPVSDSWNVKATFGGEGRRSAPAFVVAGAAYVMTGKGASGKHRDCWQYMPFFTGIEENEISGVNVYPNPATDFIHFEIDPAFSAAHAPLSVALFDAQGKKVTEQSCDGFASVILQNQSWAPGTYLYTLTDGTKNYGSGRILIR